MRILAWSVVGAFGGWRAWRLAHSDIHRLRENASTFGEAFVAHTKLAPYVWAAGGALLWALFAGRYSSDFSVGIYGLWSVALLRLLLIDIDTHVLPRTIVSRATAMGLAALIFLSVVDDTGHPWGIFAGGIALWVMLKILEVVSRGDLGGGDVSLGPLLGMYVGWIGFERIFIALLAGFVLGGLFAIGLVTLGRATRRTFIAFGPFLIVGSFVGVLR